MFGLIFGGDVNFSFDYGRGVREAYSDRLIQNYSPLQCIEVQCIEHPEREVSRQENFGTFGSVGRYWKVSLLNKLQKLEDAGD